MESSSTGEFLLGVEEYLTQTGNLDQANQVHTLARAFMGDNPKESCSRAFLQDFSAAIADKDRNLADLLHKTVLAQDQIQYRRAVLHYLATLETFSTEQKNLMFKTLKANSYSDVLRSFLIFLISSDVLDQSVKDFLFRTSKLENQTEIFKDLLNYFIRQDYAEQLLKDLVHQTTRSDNVNDAKKSLLSYIGKQDSIDQPLKDLIHQLTKTDGTNTVIHLLSYIGKQDSIDQPTRDLIYKTIKADDLINIRAALASYIARQQINSNLTVLIFNLIKSQSIEETFKDVLKFIAEQAKDNLKQKLVDLLYKIVKTSNTEEAVRCLILYYNDTDNKDLNDFIFRSFKNESNFENYKAVLRYAGIVSNVDRNISDLSLAVARALDSDQFDSEFTRAYMAKLDRQYQSDKLFRGINSCIKNNVIDQTVINDAFSRSQLRSKFWLADELAKIKTNFNNVAILAGWFGQLKNIYSKKLTYKKMRIVDIDAVACEASDLVFNLSNLENHKVKSIRADINNLTLHANGYEWNVENFRELTSYTEKFLPDLIINTSAEHMTEEWFHQIRFKQLESNPIVVIQSNNLFDIPDHINCVHSTDHMLKKFPMKKVLYVGELQLKGYKRVMLIGRP